MAPFNKKILQSDHHQTIMENYNCYKSTVINFTDNIWSNTQVIEIQHSTVTNSGLIFNLNSEVCQVAESPKDKYPVKTTLELLPNISVPLDPLVIDEVRSEHIITAAADQKKHSDTEFESAMLDPLVVDTDIKVWIKPVANTTRNNFRPKTSATSSEVLSLRHTNSTYNNVMKHYRNVFKFMKGFFYLNIKK